MPTREQLTHERLEALITVLVAEGVIEDAEARWLRGNREFNQAPELAKGLYKRRENRSD